MTTSPERPGSDVPNVARIYDYLLGGASNFAVDRDQADALLATHPDLRFAAWANRGFLRHAVDHALGLGIDQFLDLGSGIPSAGNVHEVAQRRCPHARVAYVDHEPVAVAYSRALLADVPRTTATEADLRDPDSVLAAPGVARLLDFDRPVAVLAIAALHFVADADDPSSIVGRYRRALAPGSLLALSHSSDDYPEHPELVETRRRLVELLASTSSPAQDRSRTELRTMIETAGFAMGADGLVDLSRWAPAQHNGDPMGIYTLITKPLGTGRSSLGPNGRPRSALGTPDTTRPEPDDLAPTVSRIYDRLLGGGQNLGPDRDRADAVSTLYPRAARWTWANRAFLHHAVEYALSLGIDQFIDLGSGIPAADATHEIARRTVPHARVAYVDHESVAVTRSRDALNGVSGVSMIQADIRAPDDVLGAPGVAELLDLGRPVAVLAMAVLHCIPDADEPVTVLRAYRRAFRAGSVLALTHTSSDLPDHPDLAAAHRAVLALYSDTDAPLCGRTRAEIRTLVESAGFAVNADGLVEISRWSSHQGEPLGGYAVITEPLP